MLKHKQVVFAAIAVAALSGMVIAPVSLNQVAKAQDEDSLAESVVRGVFEDTGVTTTDGGGDDDDGDTAGEDLQEIDQQQDQEIDQDQDADQRVHQESSQDETNVQANELDTGDNTATVAQSNREDQDVDADADVKDSSANAASEADAEDDDHIKAKKSHVSDSDTTSAESQADAIISATAEATGIQGDQSNRADVDQDSSIHDVDLSNNVAFGDDTNTQIAVPIIDQDQRAANLAEQRAANLDVEDVDVFPYGTTVVVDEDGDGGFCPPGQEGRDNPRFPGCN
jgi:hypothetical protein